MAYGLSHTVAVELVPRKPDKVVRYSSQCVSLYGGLALLPVIALLFSRQEGTAPGQQLLADEIYQIPFLLSLTSIASSIPMSLDLYTDRNMPWAMLTPRAALIASHCLPSAILLVCYKIGCGKAYLQTAMVCVHFMRLNFVRAALMCPLFRCPFPPHLEQWIVPWLVTTVISSASMGYLLHSGLDMFVLGIHALMLRKFCIYWAEQRENKHGSDDHIGEMSGAITCLLSEAALLVFTRVYPEYGSVVGIMLVSAVATNVYYTQAMNARVTDSSDAHKSFLRYIAHEIRTPLNTSAVGLQLLLKSREGAPVDSETETLIDSIASIDDAVDILNDLLLVDKVDSGLMRLEKKKVNVLPLVRSIYQSFVAQATGKKISYSLEAEDGVSGASILVDRKKYGQVLRNFISNAMKFTPQGGSVRVILSVRAGSDGSGPMMRAQVSDSGVGIKPQNLKRLFHEVVQFDAAKLQDGGGSGLGLTITKAIMDAHGGSVGATSMYGHGSNFYADIAISSISSMRNADSASISGGGRGELKYTSSSFDLGNSPTIQGREDNRLDHILLVDDSALSLKMMKKLMASSAREVSIASDGAEAYNIVQAARNSGVAIDMVVTDYHMLNMDGMQLTTALRGSEYTGFIALLTGEESSDVSANFLGAGGNHVCQKPLQLRSIAQLLAAYSNFSQSR